MVRCPSCGTLNRLPQEKLRTGLQPVCGHCKAPIGRETVPLTVTDASFGVQVEQSPLPVLLDLWAPWCGPCRMLAPVIEEIAGEMAGRLRVAKLNVDENPLTARRFQVQSIPTLLVLRNGRELDRLMGAVPKPEIVRHLKNALE